MRTLARGREWCCWSVMITCWQCCQAICLLRQEKGSWLVGCECRCRQVQDVGDTATCNPLDWQLRWCCWGLWPQLWGSVETRQTLLTYAPAVGTQPPYPLTVNYSKRNRIVPSGTKVVLAVLQNACCFVIHVACIQCGIGHSACMKHDAEKSLGGCQPASKVSWTTHCKRTPDLLASSLSQVFGV